MSISCLSACIAIVIVLPTSLALLDVHWWSDKTLCTIQGLVSFATMTGHGLTSLLSVVGVRYVQLSETKNQTLFNNYFPRDLILLKYVNFPNCQRKYIKILIMHYDTKLTPRIKKNIGRDDVTNNIYFLYWRYKMATRAKKYFCTWWMVGIFIISGMYGVRWLFGF